MNITTALLASLGCTLLSNGAGLAATPLIPTTINNSGSGFSNTFSMSLEDSTGLPTSLTRSTKTQTMGPSTGTWFFELKLLSDLDSSPVAYGPSDDPNGPSIVGTATTNSVTYRWEGTYSVGPETGIWTYDAIYEITPGDEHVSVRSSVTLVDNDITGPSDEFIFRVLNPRIGFAEADGGDSDFAAFSAGAAEGAIVKNPSQRDWYMQANPEVVLNVPMVGLYGVDSYDLTYVYLANDGLDLVDWRLEADALQKEFGATFSYYPLDAANALTVQTPGEARLGLTKGDWRIMADIFREFLVAEYSTGPNAWYEGPVGSSTNTMSARMKGTVSTTQLALNNRDALDYVTTAVKAINHTVGKGHLARIYGMTSPDHFNEYYYQGSLPGHPSGPAGVVESQSLGQENLIAPYIQSWVTVDARQHGSWMTLLVDVFGGLIPGSFPPPTTMANDLGPSFIIDGANEEHSGLYFAPGKLPYGFSCTAAPVFTGGTIGGTTLKGWLSRNVRETVYHHENFAAYLDYFGAARCYSTDSTVHDHAIGASRTPLERRIQNIADIKADVLADQSQFDGFTFVTEAVQSRSTEICNLMHAFPFSFPYVPLGEIEVVVIENEENPEKPIILYIVHSSNFQDLSENSQAVPIFHTAHDNVKLATIDSRVPKERDYACWALAYEVLFSGHIVKTDNPESLGGALMPFQDKLSQGRYFLMSLLGRFIREQFLDFHNGTLRGSLNGYSPGGSSFTTSAVPMVFKTNIDVPTITYPLYLSEFEKKDFQNAIRPYLKEPLIHSVYRAADGRYAVVVCNPFVEDNQMPIDMSFTFDPVDYADFSLATYDVVQHGLGGSTTVATGHSGAFSVSNFTVEPGQIYFWEFK